MPNLRVPVQSKFSTGKGPHGELIDAPGRWLKLALNLGGQNLDGFAALYLGVGLGRFI